MSDEDVQRGHTVVDLKMEALAHAIHVTAKLIERTPERVPSEPGPFIVGLAERLERYLTGPALVTSQVTSP